MTRIRFHPTLTHWGRALGMLPRTQALSVMRGRSLIISPLFLFVMRLGFNFRFPLFLFLFISYFAILPTNRLGRK